MGKKVVMKKGFSLEKYVGEWYELVHYASFFQKKGSNNYNTTAKYTLLEDGIVDVMNTTYSNGKMITSHGIGHYLGKLSLRVDFDLTDVAKFMPKDGTEFVEHNKDLPNYIIKKIWIDNEGDYSFAVVTDTTRSTLWVLSKQQHPSQENYEDVMTYVNEHFDKEKFILTPHYSPSDDRV